MAPVHREVFVPQPTRPSTPGKQYVVAIGIDHYRSWDRLHNAVADARGTCAAFQQLGFEAICPPLIEDEATGARLERLVHNDLRALGTNDSLVVFFAGHGYAEKTEHANQRSIRTGYLLPVDARPDDRDSWVRADTWLSDISLLPARHIFVILDACHSGITLDGVIRYRGSEPRLPQPIEHLKTRQSRRIITSALDGQLAMDSGPIPGHSLFTGCLIQALTGGVFASLGRAVATASEISSLVRSRVIEYPNSTQTPDSGALELHDHGELVVEHRPEPPRPPARVTGPHDLRSRAPAQDLTPRPAREVGAGAIRSKSGAQPAASPANPSPTKPVPPGTKPR